MRSPTQTRQKEMRAGGRTLAITTLVLFNTLVAFTDGAPTLSADTTTSKGSYAGDDGGYGANGDGGYGGDSDEEDEVESTTKAPMQCSDFGTNTCPLRCNVTKTPVCISRGETTTAATTARVAFTGNPTTKAAADNDDGGYEGKNRCFFSFFFSPPSFFFKKNFFFFFFSFFSFFFNHRSTRAERGGEGEREKEEATICVSRCK